MASERWRQIEEIFQSALDLEGDSRTRFLSEACAGDEKLCAEVEALIQSYEAAGNFIEQPIGWLDDIKFDNLPTLRIEEEPPGEMLGKRVGAYRLARELGRGGMGSVYLAERADSEFRKLVAVKLVKRGMDTDFILQRFRQERQALAALNHPNIARLLDGGATDDGLPYIVMEYVKGQPVDTYSDAHRLSVRARLQLFLEVCAGVSHAHQSLVIHRDIKPSNILVTEEGVPKLLDFGIAKILDQSLSDETLQSTATAYRLMTPEYASPEQVRGESVTTASDVYSLGVLLYLLLTGRRPYYFRSRRLEEMTRIVCEQNPPRPSALINRAATQEASTEGSDSIPESTSSLTKLAHDRSTTPERLRRSLADDVDNIVLKALRKEPSRRYTSVEQFAEDIKRHLEGLPVTARTDTFTYRGRKFVRRHKAGVVATCAVAVALVGGLAATTWQARIARIERARAEAEGRRAKGRFEDLRRLTHSLMFELHDAIHNLQGATPARELLAKRTLEYLDSLAREASDDPSLQSELVIAYINLGDVQGNPFYPNIGDAAGALESYRKAASLAESLSNASPKDVRMRRRLWLTQVKIGDMLVSTGGTTKAAEHYRKAQALIEELTATRPDDSSLQQDLGSSYDRNGNLQLSLDDPAAALDSYRRALAIFEKLSAADSSNDALRRNVASSHGKIGSALMKLGMLNQALSSYRALVELNRARLAADPANALTRDDLAGSLGALAEAQAASGEFDGAMESCRQQLSMYQEMSAADPTNVRARQGLANALERLNRLSKKRRAIN
ncbi:MAG TPA: protein kinase [Pyrinomonadaceae bacterium]|jgi:non-specific serine/threonine protein kinase/serine/threonine-protein kinase